MSNRRDFLKKTAIITAAGFAAVPVVKSFSNNLQTANEASGDGDPYTLPPLPYKYESLEPYIDTLTMQIHHDKHHAKYVSNLNDIVKGMEWEKFPTIDELIKNISKYPPGIRNNAGGHYNHTMFWETMAAHTTDDVNKPAGKLADTINTVWGSFDEFKKKFYSISMDRFGSGWAWLVKTADGKLAIGSTPNQDNPMMDIADFKGTPLMMLDVWEHAYYLKYQNKRADYINNWWNIVNWNTVAKRFA